MTLNLEELTIKQVREIAALAGCATKKRAAKSFAEEPVIVRAYSGVFFGYLVSKTGACVELRDARQIWSWDSAGLAEKSQTCGDIAMRGLGTGSKVSAPVTRSIVEQVGATFFATDAAVKTIAAQKWASK